MPRITSLSSTPLDIILALCDGNPGAATVCRKVMEQTPITDPQNSLGGIGVILGFDTNEIYGPDIWVLYKDVCHMNIIYLLAVMRSVQLGHNTLSWLKNQIAERKSVDCEEILKNVMNQLSEFNRNEELAA